MSLESVCPLFFALWSEFSMEVVDKTLLIISIASFKTTLRLQLLQGSSVDQYPSPLISPRDKPKVAAVLT